jgi:hypothetical protein
LRPRIVAEEAISQLLEGQLPDALPMEGAVAHLQKLQEFAQGDQYALMQQSGNEEKFRAYLTSVAELARAEQATAQAAAAAGQFGQGASRGNGAAGGENPQQQPQLGPGELIDETLPGARGVQ